MPWAVVQAARPRVVSASKAAVRVFVNMSVGPICRRRDMRTTDGEHPGWPFIRRFDFLLRADFRSHLPTRSPARRCRAHPSPAVASDARSLSSGRRSPRPNARSCRRRRDTAAAPAVASVAAGALDRCLPRPGHRHRALIPHPAISASSRAA